MSRVWKSLKIIGFIIKLLIGLVVAGVIAILAWRVLSSGNPKDLEGLVLNDKLVEAYFSSEDDGLYMFRQEQRSVTSGEENYGYFAITENIFVPEANQVHTLVRYNNSTVRALAEDYSLEEVPSRQDELFDITLVFAIDLTPEDDSDNLANKEGSVEFVRVNATLAGDAEKNIYNFRKLVFDLDESGLDLKTLLEEDLLLAVYADFYYVNDIDYEKTPYGALCLYDYITEDIEVKLTSKDEKAFENYRDNGAK
jgi:hypothetical protein